MPLARLAAGPQPFSGWMSEDYRLVSRSGWRAGGASPTAGRQCISARRVCRRASARPVGSPAAITAGPMTGPGASSASRNSRRGCRCRTPLSVWPIIAPPATAMPGLRSTTRCNRFSIFPRIAIPTSGCICRPYERWDNAPLRFMENSFDAAHFSFVHRGTFGDFAQPKPSKYELEETGYGFFATTLVDIVNPPEAYRVTGTTAPMTSRDMRNHWYLPFSRRLDITYPSGLRHLIINCSMIERIDAPATSNLLDKQRTDSGKGLPGAAVDRRGCRGCRSYRGGPRSDRPRCAARPGPPCRGQYAVRPPGIDH